MAVAAPLGRHDLGDLHLIGSGGEGQIFRCSRLPGMVFKEFKSIVRHELDPSGLESTIAALETLPAVDRSFVVKRTAWPTAAVKDGANLLGFVMAEIDPTFVVKYGVASSPKNVPCDWNLLMFRDRDAAKAAIVSGAPAVGDDEVIGLLLDLALLFDTFHRNGLIVGDVSGANILWRLTPSPQVFLIDCDGIRRAGAAGVTRSKQSPGWIDPRLEGDSTMSSDLYKLSLAIFRAYFALPTQTPEVSTGSQSPIGQRIQAMAQRSTSESRPTAREWIQLLFALQRELRAAERLQRAALPTRVGP